MAHERGSALVETIFLMLVLLVPLVWLLGTLGRIHEAALSTTTAAREAGAALARSTDATRSASDARLAVSAAFSNQGLSAEAARVQISTGRGVERGAEVKVEIAYPVVIVGSPFGDRASSAVWVRASHTAAVDLYRSR